MKVTLFSLKSLIFTQISCLYFHTQKKSNIYVMSITRFISCTKRNEKHAGEKADIDCKSTS